MSRHRLSAAPAARLRLASPVVEAMEPRLLYSADAASTALAAAGAGELAGLEERRQLDAATATATQTPTEIVFIDASVTDADALVADLQRRGIDSQLLYFPDENHWVLKPANSRRWHDEVFGWLNKHLEETRSSILEKYGVELIGADFDAIQRGEDRQMFKDIVAKVGGESARSRVCHTMEEVRETVADLGYPVVVRPSFTMGGLGSGMAYNEDDLDRIAGGGLAAAPTANVLIEESILGWKEYELELMRDNRDNVVVVCSIENVDPVGVHTGDSITVAPAMTLTDREYQKMRDLSIDILREVGVDTGGCNIQFAINPADGRMIVIEMNPRVSRSSALASKATGFPIAKIAAKMAIGYTLDEVPNDITEETPAAFEPTLDYVVVKVPRFAFEKFPAADPTLTTTMKSVGEAMAIGRNFTEALQKALRSAERSGAAFHWDGDQPTLEQGRELLEAAKTR